LIEDAMTIIGIDQTADSESRSASIARTVTVEATPAQVAALATAQSTGRLSLALVGFNDETEVESVTVDQNQLLGIKEEVAEEAVEERICTIRTRRNGELIETPVPCKE